MFASRISQPDTIVNPLSGALLVAQHASSPAIDPSVVVLRSKVDFSSLGTVRTTPINRFIARIVKTLNNTRLCVLEYISTGTTTDFIVKYSDDFGASWNNSAGTNLTHSGGLNPITPQDMITDGENLVIVTANSNLAANGTILVSVDGGTSFSNLGNVAGSSFGFTAVARSAITGRIIAHSYAGPRAVYSDDNGSTWTADTTFPNSLTYRSAFVTNSGQFVFISSIGTVVYGNVGAWLSINFSGSLFTTGGDKLTDGLVTMSDNGSTGVLRKATVPAGPYSTITLTPNQGFSQQSTGFARVAGYVIDDSVNVFLAAGKFLTKLTSPLTSQSATYFTVPGSYNYISNMLDGDL